MEELGADTHVFFGVAAPAVRADARAEADSDSLLADESTLFAARVDPAARVRSGETVELAVDPEKFYFFDPENGVSLAGPHVTAEADQSASAHSGIDHIV